MFWYTTNTFNSKSGVKSIGIPPKTYSHGRWKILQKILRVFKKQITIQRRRPDGSVKVLLVEFDRTNPRKGRVIKDRYIIHPNEVIMLGRRT